MSSTYAQVYVSPRSSLFSVLQLPQGNLLLCLRDDSQHWYFPLVYPPLVVVVVL